MVIVTQMDELGHESDAYCARSPWKERYTAFWWRRKFVRDADRRTKWTL